MECFSIIFLNEFEKEEFGDSLDRFNKRSFTIKTIKELKEYVLDWEAKFFNLSQQVELDVPTDTELNEDKNHWRANNLTPWFKPEDVYVVLEGEKWVALSSYDRGDRKTDAVSTELTGVLPEYRRKSICTALKIHALLDFKNKGFEKVFTSNEENNPMYKINLKLGFKTIGTEVGCKLFL